MIHPTHPEGAESLTPTTVYATRLTTKDRTVLAFADGPPATPLLGLMGARLGSPITVTPDQGPVRGRIHLSNWAGICAVELPSVQDLPSANELRDGVARGGVLLVDEVSRRALWAGDAAALAWIRQRGRRAGSLD